MGKNEAMNEEPREEFMIEEALTKLDGIVKELESGDIGLEDSFARYREGMKLLKKVTDAIGTYEKKMQILAEDAGAAEEDEEEA